MKWHQMVMPGFLGAQLLLSAGAVHAETVAERFDRAMKEFVEENGDIPHFCVA